MNKLEKLGAYAFYGLVRAVPYAVELTGIMFFVDGFNEKNSIHTFGGASLYVMGRVLNNLLSRERSRHLAEEGELPKLVQSDKK